MQINAKRISCLSIVMMSYFFSCASDMKPLAIQRPYPSFEGGIVAIIKLLQLREPQKEFLSVKKS